MDYLARKLLLIWKRLRRPIKAREAGDDKGHMRAEEDKEDGDALNARSQYQMSNQLPMTNQKKYDIKERCLIFAARAAKFTDKLPKKQTSFEYGGQLIRSSASTGANLEEADGALSKKDFLNKIGIARKEAKESGYWLKLIKLVKMVNNPENLAELDWLVNESGEIKLILSSIINKTKARD